MKTYELKIEMKVRECDGYHGHEIASVTHQLDAEAVADLSAEDTDALATLIWRGSIGRLVAKIRGARAEAEEAEARAKEQRARRAELQAETAAHPDDEPHGMAEA